MSDGQDVVADVLEGQRGSGDGEPEAEDRELGGAVASVQPASQWLTPVAMVAQPGLSGGSLS